MRSSPISGGSKRFPNGASRWTVSSGTGSTTSSTLQSVNSYGEEIRTYTREYDLERRIYETLARKGLLDGRAGGEQNPKYFGELTSEGRCWFLDRDEAARIERENIRGGRRHDYLVALFSVVSGAIAGFIGGAAAPALIALIRTALRM